MKLPVLKLLSLFLLEGTSSFSVQSPNQSQSSSFFPQQSITFASSSSSQSNKYDDDGASVMYEWFNDLVSMFMLCFRVVFCYHCYQKRFLLSNLFFSHVHPNIFIAKQIDSTPYFERVVPSVLVPVSVPTALKERDNQLAFTIPSMNNAKISLRKHEVQGCTICIENINENDYGAICAKLYESQCTFNESRKQNSNTAIDNNQNLRQIVKDYFSKQTPHTGYDASIFKNNEKVESILLSSTTTTSKGEEGSNPNTINEILQTLQQKGYVTIDTNLKTNREAYTKLSSFLQKKTKQDTSIRSDTVAFLDINDGKQCELQNQFDVLMGMAAFLNDNLTFEECEFEPLLPATREKPLTNPRNIQAAEYGFGEYYVAHR